MASKTYRYKFSQDFKNQLIEFSRIHKYDEATVFRDNWDIWCENNKKIIDDEIKVLKINGYTGDALVKMYKSVRYYFKNKSEKKKSDEKKTISWFISRV